MNTGVNSGSRIRGDDGSPARVFKLTTRQHLRARAGRMETSREG